MRLSTIKTADPTRGHGLVERGGLLMDGVKLAHAVRHRWPPVHIIATSAYRAALIDELPTGSVFLHKPYSDRNIIGTLDALTA